MLDSLQMLFSHTYVGITFLIIFATMWFFDIRFDTRFFAIASCMLGYIELSVLNFGVGIHTFAQYLTAEKRIQVHCLGELEEEEKEVLFRISYYWVNRKEMIDCYQHRSKNCEWRTRMER